MCFIPGLSSGKCDPFPLIDKIHDWSVHVHKVCLKANRKLAVLRSVRELNRKKLDLLYKLTVGEGAIYRGQYFVAST